MGFVGILVGDGKKINDSLDLKWTNKVFKTWITEEGGKWEPNCVGVVGEMVAEKDTVADDIMEETVPEELHGSKLEGDRGENETLEVLLEEGELRD